MVVTLIVSTFMRQFYFGAEREFGEKMASDEAVKPFHKESRKPCERV